MLSSPHDSPFILVLCVSRSSRNSHGVTPCGAAKQRWGMKMSRFSTNNLLYLRNGWRQMGAFYKHWILFPTVWHLPRLSQGRTQGRPKCAKMCQNGELLILRLELMGKWEMGNGYMLRVVWQALNSLSIHVTFTAMHPGEAKICKNVIKWRTFTHSASWA